MPLRDVSTRGLNKRKASKPIMVRGIPDNNSGHDGDIVYAEIDAVGLVQYVKNGGRWRKVSHRASTAQEQLQSVAPPAANGFQDVALTGLIRADGSVSFTGNQSHGGHNIYSVGDLDADGLTTLDETNIDTTDGSFTVRGDNPIQMETLLTSSDIDIDSGGNVTVLSNKDFYVDVGISANINSVDNSGFRVSGTQGIIDPSTLTLSAGTVSRNYRGVVNVNSISDGNDAGGEIGIHLKTITSGVQSCSNAILIEQTGSILPDDIDGKGVDTWTWTTGVDLRADTGIRLRAESTENLNTSSVWIRATGDVVIGGGTEYLSGPPPFSPNRTIANGLFEMSTVYKSVDNKHILTDIGYTSNFMDEGEPAVPEYAAYKKKIYPRWDGIDTYSMSQAQTHTAVASEHVVTGGPFADMTQAEAVADGEDFLILSNLTEVTDDIYTGGHDHDAGEFLYETTSSSYFRGTDFYHQGTVWLVTVVFHCVDAEGILTDDFGLNAGYVFGRGMAGTWAANQQGANITDINVKAPHKYNSGDDTFTEEVGYSSRYSTLPTTKGMIWYNSVTTGGAGADDVNTGIQWHNDTGSPCEVLASVLRLQSGKLFGSQYGVYTPGL